MFDNKMQELIEVIDENKDNISNNDYVQICNLLKEIYNNHQDDMLMRNNDDHLIHLNYRDVKIIKQFVNIFSIITNIACIVLMYIHMHNIAKLLIIDKA